jgi:hypothetical protein
MGWFDRNVASGHDAFGDAPAVDVGTARQRNAWRALRERTAVILATASGADK